MKLTLDASVHLNALNPHEAGSADSQAVLRHAHGEDAAGAPRCEVFSPTLLLIEVAACVARALADPALAAEVTHALRYLPGQTMIPLSELLAEETSRLAARHQVRGTDAVYGAVAQLYGSTLITLNGDQLEKLSPEITVWRPEEALRHLEAAAVS